MTPRLTFLLRLFVLMAVPFGLLMLPFNVAIAGWTDSPFDGHSVIAAGVSAVLYGLFMTILMGRRHVKGVEALVGDVTREALRPRQHRTVRVALPADRAFERSLDAVRSITRATITTSDPVERTIVAGVGATMSSWGETISVRVRTEGAESAAVEIESRPSFRLTIADYGINLGHVLQIERSLAGPAPRGG